MHLNISIFQAFPNEKLLYLITENFNTENFTTLKVFFSKTKTLAH